MSYILLPFHDGKILNIQQFETGNNKIIDKMYQLLKTFLDEDQAKLITIMIVTIPLSYLMYLLKSKYLILAISISFSLLFQHIMFPQQKYILWVQQQIVYLMLKFGPRARIGFLVLVVTLVYLSAVQLRRMYVSYAVNGVDITGILMMQTFLYVGLAYNYQHGLKPDTQLSEDANKRKVKDLPDYLTYMGYVCFLPASQVGPVFQYRDYEDYINRKGDYQNIPNTIKPALKQLGVFIASLVVYFGTKSFDIWLTVKPEFAEHSYAYKIFFINAVIFHITFKYISAWSLGLVAIHATGISYSKQNNNFQKIQVTKIIRFYREPSFKVKIECWNMSIQTALKRYIYDINLSQKQNIDQKSKKKLQASAQQRTLFVSALWHGLYPGYFLSFFHWMIYLRMGQQLFRLRKKNPSVDAIWNKYKLDYVECFASNFALLFYGIFFHIMTWQNAKAILYATYGIPLLVLYGLYFVIYEAEMLSKPKKVKTDRGSATSSSSEGSQDNSPIPVRISEVGDAKTTVKVQ